MQIVLNYHILTWEGKKWNTKTYNKGHSRWSVSANSSNKMNDWEWEGWLLGSVFRIPGNLGIMPKMSFLETKHRLFSRVIMLHKEKLNYYRLSFSTRNSSNSVFVYPYFVLWIYLELFHQSLNIWVIQCKIVQY